MIAYLDSSVLLRIALNQKNKAKEFSQITLGVSSQILKVECLRTLDRLHVMGHINEDKLLALSDFIYESLARIELIPVTDPILEQASEPRGLKLGTLDAIHLATALALGDELDAFVTYDDRLADAARALGLPVVRPA